MQISIFYLLFTSQLLSAFSLILDSSGHAKYARQIGDYFEGGIRVQCVDKLKKVLEQQNPALQVTALKGQQSIDPLYNANIANRLQPDLYISIHFFFQQEIKSHLYIYYFLYNPITDFWRKPDPDSFSFMPYYQGYLLSLHTSKKIAETLHASFGIQKNNIFQVINPLGIPFGPLSGLIMPAIAIEMGIQKPEDLDCYIPILATAIATTINHEYFI